jgi:hypothetical protein
MADDGHLIIKFFITLAKASKTALRKLSKIRESWHVAPEG